MEIKDSYTEDELAQIFDGIIKDCKEQNEKPPGHYPNRRLAPYLEQLEEKETNAVYSLFDWMLETYKKNASEIRKTAIFGNSCCDDFFKPEDLVRWKAYLGGDWFQYKDLEDFLKNNPDIELVNLED